MEIPSIRRIAFYTLIAITELSFYYTLTNKIHFQKSSQSDVYNNKDEFDSINNNDTETTVVVDRLYNRNTIVAI